MNINIKSFTTAQKAAGLLKSRGIRCMVERRFGRGTGCGFSLKITDPSVSRREVCALLGSIGVDCGANST